MNEETKGTSRALRTYAYIFSAILVIGYIVIYQFLPLEDSWNDGVLNILTLISAFFPAVIASLIFFIYETDDTPRIIWGNLVIGCWLWFAAEVAWVYFVMTSGELPIASIVDWSWLIGFIFFTLALYYQYSLINPSKKIFYRNVAIGAWVVVLLIPLVILYLTNALELQTYINFFYPFADLAVGIAGVLLILAFHGGSLMLPWLGLVVFGVTDFLYAWTEQTGLYAWSSEAGNPLTLFIDTSYIAAYLILGLGFLGHWVLLKYGIMANHTPNA